MGIEPAICRFIAQCLNHLAQPELDNRHLNRDMSNKPINYKAGVLLNQLTCLLDEVGRLSSQKKKKH
jgi:hypothetical protein